MGLLYLQGNRVCLAVPGGSTPPKGMLLGSTPGGSIVYVEPTAAAPLNNDLAAARGEAYAAEESVLWRLTGTVMEDLDSLQHNLDVVRTLISPLISELHYIIGCRLALVPLGTAKIC